LGIRRLDTVYPALFVVGVFGTIGAMMLALIGISIDRVDAILIPLKHFDVRTILYFDLELVLFLSLGGQLLQALALRCLPVAFVVALTSYGSIFAGLIASATILGERLNANEYLAGGLLLAALAVSVLDRLPSTSSSGSTP
jgi:drug/metabolite transporter (DMT)-like permease